MNESHEVYARARDRLLTAQAEYEAAGAAMREAEEAVAGPLSRAWELNQRAVTDAEQAAFTARKSLAEVEGDVGRAARKRYMQAGGVGLVILTDTEQSRVDEARAAVDSALANVTAAHDRFKAGVTVEQLINAESSD